ncbi:MAG: hypothetical protein ABGX47_01070 [Martelella sp.]|uniref:hypothetical protein n=1 Tax=Martelella sp. TaxID=1969699 RepID=UPI003242DEA8
MQFEIGSLAEGMGIPIEEWEGSPGHMLLHGLAGCAAAAASGNGCAAGAAGAVAQSLFAGSLGGTALSEQELQRRATVFSALAGYFFSGGNGDNVSNAANIGLSGFTNNYLTHEQLDALVDELTACEGRSNVSACKSAVSEKYEKLDFAQQQAFEACRTSDCLNDHLSQMQFDQKRLYEQVMAAQLRWVDEALAQRILANQMNERALTGNGSVLEERIMAVAAGVSHCEATGQAAGCFARGQALQLISENVGMAVYEALGIAALKPGMPGRGNAGEVSGTGPGRVGPSVTESGRQIEFDGQFYSADGFKFSSSYYDRLWSSGGVLRLFCRQGPSWIANQRLHLTQGVPLVISDMKELVWR